MTVYPVIKWVKSATGEADDYSPEYSKNTWLNTDSDDSIYFETIATYTTGCTTGYSLNSGVTVVRTVTLRLKGRKTNK